MNARNKEIIYQVLNGASTNSVAKKNNLTNERIRQIVAKECHKINGLEYEKIDHRMTVNIPELRKRKHYFLFT